MRNISKMDGARIDAMADEFCSKTKLQMPRHSKLFAAARQAKRKIAEGKSVPMDYDSL
jgi:hypothetical protein